MKSYERVGTATIIGLVDNISYADETSEVFIKGMKIVEPWKLRLDMNATIEDRLRKSKIIFNGPKVGMKYPVGSYFFKMKDSSGKQDVKDFVTKKLGVVDMKMPLSGYFGLNMPIGMLVEKLPKDKEPEKLDFCSDEIATFAAQVASFYYARDNTTPYFFEVDGEFKKKYPINF